MRPLGTERWKNSPSEENESVDTDQDVAVGVDLQEVSIHGVEHEAPGHRSSKISEELSGYLYLLYPC